MESFQGNALTDSDTAHGAVLLKALLWVVLTGSAASLQQEQFLQPFALLSSSLDLFMGFSLPYHFFILSPSPSSTSFLYTFWRPFPLRSLIWAPSQPMVWLRHTQLHPGTSLPRLCGCVVGWKLGSALPYTPILRRLKKKVFWSWMFTFCKEYAME